MSRGAGATDRPWQHGLRNPGARLGTFLHLPSPALVEIICRSGFDFVILDMEHGEFGIAELGGLIRAADACGTPAVVRVPSNDAPLIGKALDLGADAVLVPHIASAADAERAVAAAKYPPTGTRGAFPFMRATGYRSGYRPGWEAEQNEVISVILLVEGAAGIENIEEIVRVPGVASVFVGPVDLSHALGLAGQLRHPEVEALAYRIGETARAAGLHPAIFCNDLDAAATFAAAGFKLIAYSVDAQIIHHAYRDARRGFDNRTGAAPEEGPAS